MFNMRVETLQVITDISEDIRKKVSDMLKQYNIEVLNIEKIIIERVEGVVFTRVVGTLKWKGLTLREYSIRGNILS